MITVVTSDKGAPQVDVDRGPTTRVAACSCVYTSLLTVQSVVCQMWGESEREAQHLVSQSSPSSALPKAGVPILHRRGSSLWMFCHSGTSPRAVAPGLCSPLSCKFSSSSLFGKILVKGELWACAGVSVAHEELSVSGLQKVADDSEKFVQG